MARPLHPDRECDRRQHADRERDEADRVAPGPLLAVDRAEGEPTHRKADDRGADPVKRRRGLLIPALGHVAPGRPGRHRDERDVDEEGGPPRDGVDEDAADQRAEDGRRPRGAGPDAECPSLLLAREVGREERQRPRHEQRTGGSLQDPEGDEQLHVGREAAERGGRAEADESKEEGPLPPVEVVHRAGEDQDRAERQQVGVETYDWPSSTPRKSRGRSRPMRGRATLTTVESRKTMPEPSTAAVRIQRFVLMPGAYSAVDQLRPVERLRPAIKPPAMSTTTTSGQSDATGGTPLLGRPGTVLPVTVLVAVSLAGFGSAGVVPVRVAVFVTGVVRLTLTVSCRVAVAPKASGPTFQMPVPGV